MFAFGLFRSYERRRCSGSVESQEVNTPTQSPYHSRSVSPVACPRRKRTPRSTVTVQGSDRSYTPVQSPSQEENYREEKDRWKNRLLEGSDERGSSTERSETRHKAKKSKKHVLSKDSDDDRSDKSSRLSEKSLSKLSEKSKLKRSLECIKATRCKDIALKIDRTKAEKRRKR